MKTLGNLIWLVLIGFWHCLGYMLAGIIFCITIIGIPLGIACFRIGSFALLPFGRTVETDYEAHPVGNVIWLALVGAGEAVAYAIIGGILCVTIIGIPFAKQCFKLMKLSALPYGAEIT